MVFRKYPKIKRVDSAEVKYLLMADKLVITEKIDGCNLSVWKHNGEIRAGKRTEEINLKNPEKMFSTFAEWVNSSNWDWLRDGIYLYGEGLKGAKTGVDTFKNIGKINYDKKEPFVLFDIYDSVNDMWIKPQSEIWDNIVDAYNSYNYHKNRVLNCVPIVGFNIGVLNLDELNEYLGKSRWSDNVNKEGIVIKHYKENGDVEMAKFVTQEFQEFQKRKPKPRGNKYEEVAVSVITKPRVEKIMRKEGITEIKDFGKLIKYVVEDVFDEESHHLKEIAWKMFTKEFGKLLPNLIRKEFEEIRKEEINNGLLTKNDA